MSSGIEGQTYSKTSGGCSAVAPREILHEGRQRLDCLQRNSVVERSAHAAERLVALEREQAGSLRLGQEGAIERVVMQGERHVHARARGRCDRVAVEATGTVDRAVQQRRLGTVALAH